MKLEVFIGWDAREAVTADVLSHSILKRTNANVKINYLKHRELRQRGLFNRPWLIESDTGNWKDLLDNKQFSTEFSHTRFLVPSLMNHKGWALFLDSDMVFLSDIKKLFELCDDKYAVMCVKHIHKPKHGDMKMDGRQQLSYPKKNWSSFVLFNCGHKSNKGLTPEKVNFMKGADLHSFSWLHESEIGNLPPTYNYIVGVSQKIPHGKMPDVIHFTEGGPWFDECREIPYGGTWSSEYEDWQKSGGGVSGIATVRFDSTEDAVPLRAYPSRKGSISMEELDELEFTEVGDMR